MISGELDYFNVFGLSYDDSNLTEDTIRNIQYPETANFVWVIFLVFIPILLSNMLVGITIADLIQFFSYTLLCRLAWQLEMLLKLKRMQH